MLKIVRGRNQSAHQLLLVRNRNTLTEVKNIVYGSKIRCRGRSYAAAVPSDIPKPRKGQRIPKDERRAMVESFVNKYRATHGGKFPSPSDTQKHIGGGYYAIRAIIQELEFKSKMAPSDRETETLLEVQLVEESKVTVNVDVEAQNDANSNAKDVDIDDACKNHVQAEKDSLTFDVAEGTLFEEAAKPVASGGQSETEGNKKEEADGVPSYSVAKESDSLGEAEKVFHGQFDDLDEREEQIQSENLPDSGGLKHEDGQHKGSTESEKNAIDTSSSQWNEAENPKKSSLWGNLKSFADGFMKMWRKM